MLVYVEPPSVGESVGCFGSGSTQPLLSVAALGARPLVLGKVDPCRELSVLEKPPQFARARLRREKVTRKTLGMVFLVLIELCSVAVPLPW